MSKVATLVKQAQKVLTDNSPAILSAFAVAGVVSTAVLAVRVTPEATRRILDAESEHNREITNLEKIRLTWTLYLPATVTGVISIGCIITAHTVSTRRQAAMASLYTLSEATLREYQAKVLETIGKNKEQKIHDDIATDRVSRGSDRTSQIILSGDADVICHDSFTDRFFRSNMESIRRAQNDVNAECINTGYASQNDFYRYVGLPSTAFGDEVGWTPEHQMEIQFSSVLGEDGRPYLSIKYMKEPIRNYYKGYQ